MNYVSRRIAILTAALGSLTGASIAWAHGDAPHPEMLKPLHAGQVNLTATYGYELVVDKNAKDAVESAIVVYVTDHAGQKMQTAGATGTVMILTGKQKSTAALQPDGDNRLKSNLKYVAAPDMKVLISVMLAGKPAEQVRFMPLAVAMDGHTDHVH
jgi:hypothetical protein